MQDEYGRTLSDDGKWVWDGSAWRPTGAAGVTQNPAPLPGTRALSGAAPSTPDGYFAGASGPTGPAMPPPSTPWWKRPAVIIGALVVLVAVLITIILLTSGGKSHSAGPPSPSATPSIAPTTSAPAPTPSATVATTAPADTPPPSPTHTALVPDEVEPGVYECTQAGQSTGQTVSFSGVTFTTNTGSVGTYTYSRSTGAISFTGGDLAPYTGTYNPSGPSMDLQAEGITLHCAP